LCFGVTKDDSIGMYPDVVGTQTGQVWRLCMPLDLSLFNVVVV